MEELAKLEEERGNPAYLGDGKSAGGKREWVANNEICTFLILNISIEDKGNKRMIMLKICSCI